MVYVEHY